MANIHQEETLGKAYDSKLMKRLLSYAKPYWHLLLICVILLMIITLTNLARPYLLKIAIDDYIIGYQQPMYELDQNSTVKGIRFNGKLYVRENDIPQSLYAQLANVTKKIIINVNGEYYLVDGVINNDKENVQVVKEDDKYIIKTENQTFTADLLSEEQYRLFRQNDIDSLSKLGIIFLSVVGLGFLFNYLQVYILHYTSQKIIFNIRQEVFSHLHKMSLTYFDNNPVGRLVTRVTNDTETLNEMYTNVLINLFKDIFLLVGIIIAMLKLNYKLALITFLVIPLILIASIIFRIKIREVYRLVRIRLARINATLNENITGMETVHIFKKEDKKFKEFDNINKDYYDAAKREIKVYAIFRPTIEVIRSLGIALLIWFGGRDVLSGFVEFGVLYAFVNYLEQFFQPITDLTEKYNILQSAMASSERIFMILDKEEDIKNPATPKPLGNVKGKIEFKNVWFAYEDENWVLQDVSFTINPGETVAFVGATGAGKSSIINLISRFYDIQKGKILIDGKNIKEIDKYELRQHIGVVLQDVFLFTGTIKDNIRLNNADICDKKLEEVSKYVNAHNFISKLPKGYNEPVMERGATLSSGQKQLIAFARALSFNPDILILDEATSNIDTETERLIQDALLKLIKGRTTIAIAHRLSTIQHSDKIIVLHKGRIREIGTHQDLLQKEGIYYDLYRLQYKEELNSEKSII